MKLIMFHIRRIYQIKRRIILGDINIFYFSNLKAHNKSQTLNISRRNHLFKQSLRNRRIILKSTKSRSPFLRFNFSSNYFGYFSSNGFSAEPLQKDAKKNEEKSGAKDKLLTLNSTKQPKDIFKMLKVSINNTY